jgi:SH3-like domain-containing protein
MAFVALNSFTFLAISPSRREVFDVKSATPVVAFILYAGLFLSPPARGTNARPQSQTSAVNATPCDASAYVIDTDPKGLNVRSGPASTHKIIGNLPNQGVEGVGVHITGSSGEWVRIDKAEEQGGDPDRTFFSGVGWVYGPLLGANGVGWIAGGTPVYKEPSKQSRVLIRLSADDQGVVRGCRGKWVYVELKGVKGWARGEELCANSLTTCV